MVMELIQLKLKIEYIFSNAWHFFISFLFSLCLLFILFFFLLFFFFKTIQLQEDLFSGVYNIFKDNQFLLLYIYGVFLKGSFNFKVIHNRRAP